MAKSVTTRQPGFVAAESYDLTDQQQLRNDFSREPGLDPGVYVIPPQKNIKIKNGTRPDSIRFMGVDLESGIVRLIKLSDLEASYLFDTAAEANAKTITAEKNDNGLWRIPRRALTYKRTCGNTVFPKRLEDKRLITSGCSIKVAGYVEKFAATYTERKDEAGKYDIDRNDKNEVTWSAGTYLAYTAQYASKEDMQKAVDVIKNDPQFKDLASELLEF